MGFLSDSITGMRRGTALVGAVLATTLATLCAPSLAQQAPSLGTASFIAFPGGLVNTPTAIMIRHGFLAKYGVTGKYSTLPSGPGIVAALVGGSTDFADAAPALAWPVVRQGQCLKYMTSGLGNIGDLVAQPEWKLPNASKGFPESIKDIKGARVGVTTLGSNLQIWVEMTLKAAGMSPKDVTFIAIGANATAVAAFQQKLVDVAVVYPPIYQILQKSPGFQMVANWQKGNPPMLENLVQTGLATTCAYAAANPKIVQAVCKAHSEAWAFMMDPKNAEAVGAYTAENMGVTQAEGVALWNQYKSAFRSHAFSQAQWEAQGVFMADGYVPKYSDAVMPGCAM